MREVLVHSEETPFSDEESEKEDVACTWTHLVISE